MSYHKYRQKGLFQNIGNQSLPPKMVVIENLKSRKINANDGAVILNCDAKQGKNCTI
jgi:hypothetical protein